MSCLAPNYNPRPPREWGRYENPCAYIDNPEDSKPELVYRLEVLKKGNILQYKKNSSNITKQQRYAQIARGLWTNRTTTWATQTQSYTNPNTNSLKRSNFQNYNTVTLAPTSAPITCPAPVIPTNFVLPPVNGGAGPSSTPVIPPQQNPPLISPANPVIPPIVPVVEPEPVIIPDGGSLICNISENICTGQIYGITGNQFCYPTSDSDVPGPIIYLCYNDGLPTYYPRVRRTYSAGGSKWPQGEKVLFSANSIKPENVFTNLLEFGLTLENNSSESATNVVNNNITTNISSNSSVEDNLFQILALSTTLSELYNYYLNYANGNYTAVSSSLTSDNFTKLSVELNNLKNKSISAPNYDIILNFVVTSFQTLNQMIKLNGNYLSLQSQFAEVSKKASILDDMTKLEKFINDLNNTTKNNLMPDTNIIAPVFSLKPEIKKYFQLYGVPPGGVFDSTKLAEIIASL